MTPPGNTSGARPLDIDRDKPAMTVPEQVRTVLEARGVGKSFGAHAALDGVDFSLK